jgi:EpsI family protein
VIARFAVLTATFVLAIGLIGRVTRSEPVPIRNSFATFPNQIGDWQGRAGQPFDPKILAVLGVDEYVNLAFSKTAQLPLGLYIGYYRSQREGDTMHSPLNCLPGAGWEPESRRTLTIPVSLSKNPIAERQDITVNRYLIRKGVERQLVIYWYQSHGRFVASEYASKVYMVLDAVRTNRTDAALVRVVTPVSDDPAGEAAAEARAVDFVKGMVPVLRDYLPS